MKFIRLLAVLSILLFAIPGFAQTITAAAVKMDDISPFGGLYATIDGKEYKVADLAVRFWIVQAGKAIVFSAPGSPDVSNDAGQGIYYTEADRILAADKILAAAEDDAALKKAQETLLKQKLLPEGIYASSFRVDSLQEVVSRAGKSALLISLSDKADVPRFVVIAPKEGKTAFWERCRLSAFKENKLVINVFARKGPAKMGPKDKPEFVRTFDLDEVLRTGKTL